MLDCDLETDSKFQKLKTLINPNGSNGSTGNELTQVT
jgi:hypothetical protein